MTKLSYEVLQLLQNSCGHLTAEEIFLLAKKNKKDISLASTYRVLNRLVEEGMIKRINIPGEKDIFDKTIDDHEHLICSKCGKITDVHIKDVGKLISKNVNVKNIVSYDLCINYICDDCLKKKIRQKP